MNRPITAFEIVLMLAALCIALEAQTNNTLLRNANSAPRPSGVVAVSPGQTGAACALRIVTSRGPMGAPGNNTPGWVRCLQVNESLAGSAVMSSGVGAAARSSSSKKLTVLKQVDNLTPRLLQFAASGTLIPEVDIRLSHNQSGTMVPYEVYELTNSTVGAVSTQKTVGDDLPIESVAFTYQKLQRQVLKTGSNSGRPLTALSQAPSPVLRSPSAARVSTAGTAAVAGTGQPLPGTPGQPLLASGVKPTTLMRQRQIGGSGPTSAPIPSKGNGHNEFEAVTTQRSVTQDANFTQWTNSTQSPGGHGVSQVAPVPSGTLTTTVVGNACAKDPSLRILGVAGSTAAVTFVPGHTYTIWGCSFGPSDPHNAVYLSDGGSFTWYLQKTSWTNNSVVVSVSTAPKSAKSNLMLFVLGQNGNTKLNGVTLQ